MASVATQIALLQEQMTTTIAKLDGLDRKLDIQGDTYLPRKEFNEWKRGQNYQKILIALITAIVVGVIEYGILHR